MLPWQWSPLHRHALHQLCLHGYVLSGTEWGRQGLVRNNNGKEAHEGERFNNNTEYTFTAQEYFLNSGQNIRDIMRSLKKLLRSSKMLL